MKKTLDKTTPENPLPETAIPETPDQAVSDIPEWTASEKYIKEAAEPPEIQTYTEPQQYAEPEESSETETETGQDMETDQIPEPETQTLDALIPELTNADETEDTLQLVSEEPELSPEEEPAFLSEDHLSSDLNMADASHTLEGFSDIDNDADAQLNTFLNRLDISDNIRRMNESAREDIADIIERDDSENELHEAKPAVELDFEPHQPLPKYVKPEFYFEIEPISQPLQDVEGSISEYDKVPTINDLEKKWRDVNEGPAPRLETTTDMPEDETSATQYSFAYSLEDIQEAVAEPDPDVAPQIHSEEIVKKNGMNQRSYHKLTIG